MKYGGGRGRDVSRTLPCTLLKEERKVMKNYPDEWHLHKRLNQIPP
jgi:hypothetical protein